ncbi:MAG TPA: hypothetical protein VG055_09710 [Planctomycetaceae bacterium]|jgi:hypothetical protein|nr:hypothetical protein [Planctomycetaceae bacterium]
MPTRASWGPPDICLSFTDPVPDESLSATVYERVCRTDFSEPGFCLIELGPATTSHSLRGFMVGLKRSLQEIHRTRRTRDLAFRSLARFDQQSTTKLHRDGGPDECFLMLGYEPTEIRGELAMADYSLCAHDVGLTPADLLAQYNPMFGRGEELLRAYLTSVACFSNRCFQILLINNSAAPYSESEPAWQGVLHMARIQNPSDELRRIVNSAMVVSLPVGVADAISDADQDEFLSTNVVHRRGYERRHLSDDK